MNKNVCVCVCVCVCMCVCVCAVSYTHLDVYKRQVRESGSFQLEYKQYASDRSYLALYSM